MFGHLKQPLLTRELEATDNEANQEMFFVPPLNCRTPKSINNIPLIQNTGSGSLILQEE